MTQLAPTTAFERLRRSARIGIIAEFVGCALAACALFVVFSYAADRVLRLEPVWRALPLAGLAIALVVLFRNRFQRPMAADLDDQELALAVERTHPELHQQLISGVQFAAAFADGRRLTDSRSLMERVVSASSSALGGVALRRALDNGRVRRFIGIGLLAVFGVGTFATVVPGEFRLWWSRNLLFSDVEWPRSTVLRFVDAPADGVLRIAERDDLTLTVEASGVVPDTIRLTFATDSGERLDLEMESIETARFSRTLEQLLEGGTVIARGGDGVTGELRLELIERPRLLDLEVWSIAPEYLGAVEQRLDASGGSVAVPEGGELRLVARASKPLREVLARFERERTDGGDSAARSIAVAPTGDGGLESGFALQFAPEGDGVLDLDVVDTDRLGSATPTELRVVIELDRAPVLGFEPVGIGSLIVANARIPGTLTASDDHALQTVGASFALGSLDATTDEEETEWRAADQLVQGLARFSPGQLEFEVETVFDLEDLEPTEDDGAPALAPGTLLTLRFRAVDGRTPDGQESFADPVRFRIVTREELLDDLDRRRSEVRRELLELVERVTAARSIVAEIVRPDHPDIGQDARHRLADLGRQQRALAQRAAGASQKYARLLDETLNNRLYEPNVVAQGRRQVVDRLDLVVADDFPRAIERTASFATEAGPESRGAALNAYDRVLSELQAVLAAIETEDSLAALIESLRELRRRQNEATELVEKKRDEQGEAIFGSDK